MQSAYPSARKAALRILPHVRDNLSSAPASDYEYASLPDADTLEAIIDAGFWASLRREEGYPPLISLAYLPPSQTTYPMHFERPIPLVPERLTRLAPAVERPGIHLGVWTEGGELSVWGATRHLPAFCLVLEVLAPGLLVLKHSRGHDSGKFVNVAVLEGDQIKVIDQRATAVPDCPDLFKSLIGIESQLSPPGSVNILIQLAVSMREHGRGGTLLVVPADTSDWQDSMVMPISYAMAPPYSALAELMQTEPEKRPELRWQDALRRAVDGTAGLTAVDGATVITTDHRVLAFGAKIVRRTGLPRVKRIIATEPIEGVAPLVIEPAQLGGTRHLSAAQFVHDQRDAIALVASQDGRFTVFGWSACEEMVHARRIESLLL
jgi:sensor domain DACNV-containing protein